ncbi:hypothetical protein Bealeia1_02048 (plasmid) [Candidatus Bealeia paramacronuclearis]|uniref:Uncharacterized protein n=1 Tax=Candidatus Bealeia paramacronuclearis TaxID=1921001 RepID=A0ABZ2CC74_9PROT
MDDVLVYPNGTGEDVVDTFSQSSSSCKVRPHQEWLRRRGAGVLNTDTLTQPHDSSQLPPKLPDLHPSSAPHAPVLQPR